VSQLLLRMHERSAASTSDRETDGRTDGLNYDSLYTMIVLSCAAW